MSNNHAKRHADEAERDGIKIERYLGPVSEAGEVEHLAHSTRNHKRVEPKAVEQSLESAKVIALMKWALFFAVVALVATAATAFASIFCWDSAHDCFASWSHFLWPPVVILLIAGLYSSVRILFIYKRTLHPYATLTIGLTSLLMNGIPLLSVIWNNLVQPANT